MQKALIQPLEGEFIFKGSTAALYELLTPILAMTANTLLNTQLHIITKRPGPPEHTD